MRKILALVLIFNSTIVLGQRDFSRMLVSQDSTYGYTAANPLKMKRGNQGKSIGYSYDFLTGLKTNDNGRLKFLKRITVRNPAKKSKGASKRKRENHSGNDDALDKYVFVTSAKDTVTIYVDLYSKGKLKIPIGLKYE